MVQVIHVVRPCYQNYSNESRIVDINAWLIRPHCSLLRSLYYNHVKRATTALGLEKKFRTTSGSKHVKIKKCPLKHRSHLSAHESIIAGLAEVQDVPGLLIRVQCDGISHAYSRNMTISCSSRTADVLSL